MEDQIKAELLKKERENNIKIIYAVESGSRAWGFASTDSDWDVRYLYIENPEWYLKIDTYKDTKEEMLENNIDIVGLELKKALRLLRKSNISILEWLISPIIYMEEHSTVAGLRKLANDFFQPKPCIYHYIRMAEKNNLIYLQSENVKMKKYFYVLRPLLACDWIKERNTMPPIEFDKLVESQVSDKNLKNEIEKLVLNKINKKEVDVIPKINLINDFINEKILFYKEYVKTLQKNEDIKTELLDDLFLKAIKSNWNINI